MQPNRHSLFMRFHFWGALIASPFAIVAALTGLLYVIAPTIDAWKHTDLDRVQATGNMRPLDDIIAAAKLAAPPGTALRTVTVSAAASESVRATFAPSRDASTGAGHAGHIAGVTFVYVNPYNATLLGQLNEEDRFIDWAKKLHSRLLLGDGARWMIELAASWFLVMVLTGIYLWWPRNTDDVVSRKSGWRRWHPWAGVALSSITLVMLLTGITWSKYSGPQMRTLRDAVGQTSAQMPKDLQSRSTPVGSDPLPLLSWQQVVDIVRASASNQTLTITPPRGDRGVWRVRALAADRPNATFEVAIDARSGEALARSDWAGQTAWGKATTVGIPFHRGEFGWWNQALLALFGAGLLFSLTTGWLMVWKRWRGGLSPLPRLLPGAWRSTPWPALIAVPALMWLMPLFALTLPMVVVVELALDFKSRFRR